MQNESYRIKGRCPMGCGETLFLAVGGYVTCGYLECPNPSRVDQLLHQFEGREPYMILVVREKDMRRLPNSGAAPGMGVGIDLNTDHFTHAEISDKRE